MMLQEEAYQVFTFGKYTPPAQKPLSNTQKSVYNMMGVGFTVESIASRMSITKEAVTNYIKVIRQKGWEL